jgi:hypothetical protein
MYLQIVKSRKNVLTKIVFCWRLEGQDEKSRIRIQDLAIPFHTFFQVFFLYFFVCEFFAVFITARDQIKFCSIYLP